MSDDAPIQIGLMRGFPGRWRLWTREDDETTDLAVRYIRADLYDALLREAMGALGMAVDDLDEWVACGDSLAKAGFNMDGTADCAERARATLAKLRSHLDVK